LAKYGLPQVTPLSERSIATKLGYPVQWLTKLRKEGIINPIKPGGFWLYSEEQVKQIPSLIAEARKCERCGKPHPLGSVPWNKRPDNTQREIIFTCKYCGAQKPIEEMEVARRFSPPLVVCRDCWKLLE